MVIVILDMCKLTVGAMARLMLMRVTCYCLDKPSTLSPRLLVDAGSVSDESTRKSLSSGEAEFYVLSLGCAAGSWVMNC